MTIQLHALRRIAFIALFSLASLASAVDVVFVGSSTISIWNTLATDFPNYSVIKSGVSGKEISYFTDNAQTLVINHNPKMIVFYAGGNDINAGKTPQTVANNYKLFVNKVRVALPNVHIAWIEQNPSPSRWSQRVQQQELNALVRTYVKTDSNQVFIDSWAAWLKNGIPDPGLYSDGLHHNAAGYKILVSQVKPYIDGYFHLTAPTGLTATAISASRIELKWTDTSNSETGYVISRSSTLTGTYTWIATTGANAQAYSSTGLTAATQYFYRIRAKNKIGSSTAVTANTKTLNAAPAAVTTASVDEVVAPVVPSAPG
jgi:lysophospholipase L1-like esterase